MRLIEKIINLMMLIGLSEFEAVSLLKMIFSSICGGLIGLEREIKGRPAGLKTFSMVCLGSTLVMITSKYINLYYHFGTGDTTRMAAQVISGIGFIGAGSIMLTGHNQIKGLTTAATLWVTAVIGLAIGSGFYSGGIMGVIVIFTTSFAYSYFNRKIMENSRLMKVFVEGKNEKFMLELFECLQVNKVKILSLHRMPENIWYANDVCATIEIEFSKRTDHDKFKEKVRELDGFRYIEEV